MHKMIATPPLRVYLVRPDGSSLWVSQSVAWAMNVRHGQRLTEDQLLHPDLLSYLEKHSIPSGSTAKGGLGI